MKNSEILAKLKAIIEKMNDNNINAWEDNMEETASVIVLQDFNKNCEDEEHPDYDPELEVKYNGWADDFEALVKELTTEQNEQEGGDNGN